MIQSQSEIKRLLQEKVFAHSSVKKFNPYSQAVFDRLSKCHTSQIGVHKYKCNNANCNHVHYQYHSCGNRHCPNCGGLKRDEWIEDRMGELLPIQYYHVVFTLPQELRSLTMGNRRLMFDLLFEASHYTLLKLGKDPKWLGAQLGIVSILHTHGQDLSFHPHIHCIVSGGGIDNNHDWKMNVRVEDYFIFPRRVMEKIYKAYFIKRLYRLLGSGELLIEDAGELISTIEKVRWKKWNVHVNTPLGGPVQIIEYLGRYTHKVAITSHRILHITESAIKFKYKDYADRNRIKEMTLSHEEFLRRLEQHILPTRFVKIRYAGYLSTRGRAKRIKSILSRMKLPPPMPKIKIPLILRVLIKTGRDISVCPICNQGSLVLEQTLIMFNGVLIDVHKLRNKGSPILHIT